MLTEIHILHLHGFLSAPQSSKARETVAYCNGRGMSDRIHVPFMKHGPAATIAELTALIGTLPQAKLGLIGSSLGGFYATCLSEQFNLPAVLINRRLAHLTGGNPILVIIRITTLTLFIR